MTSIRRLKYLIQIAKTQTIYKNDIQLLDSKIFFSISFQFGRITKKKKKKLIRLILNKNILDQCCINLYVKLLKNC